MKNLTIIKPYDDDNLKFNQNTGRYELTIQYCKDNFETTFKNDGVLQRRIRLNTQVVYTFINLRVTSVNKGVVAFLLHRTQEGRDFLLELLSAQMYADIQTGYNDLLFQPAVNFNGADKDRTQIKLNSLCVAAEQVFDESDNYFGIRIGYQGQFPYQLFLLARNYPDDSN